MPVPVFNTLLGSLTASASGSFMNFTTTAAVPAGSRIVCFVTWVSSTGAVSTVTGGGLAWTIDAVAGPTVDNKRCAIVSADCPAGLASGTVIQANFSAAGTARSMCGAAFTDCRGGSTGHVQSVIGTNTVGSGTSWTTSTGTTFSGNGLAVAVTNTSTGSSRTSTPVSPSIELYDLSPATGFDQCAQYRLGSSGSATIAGTWNSTVTQSLVIGVVYEGSFPTVTVADTVALADLVSPVKTSYQLYEDIVSSTYAAVKAGYVTYLDLLLGNFTGGAAHTRSITDTLALTDSFTRAVAYGRTQADGLVLVDSTRDAQGIRLGDLLALTDLLTRLRTTVRTFADTLTLADTATPVKTAGGTAHTRTPADTVALADQLTRAVAKARTLADTIALIDQFTRAMTKARTVTDTIALADARRIAQGQALTDTVTLTDQLTRLAPRIRTFADTVLLSDAVLTSKTGTGQLNPADLVLVADSFTRIAAYKRSVGDAVTLTDARSLGRGRRVSDQVLLADLLARVVGKSRTITDLITLTDHVTAQKVFGGYVLNDATDIRWGEIQADRVLVGVDEVWTPS